MSKWLRRRKKRSYFKYLLFFVGLALLGAGFLFFEHIQKINPFVKKQIISPVPLERKIGFDEELERILKENNASFSSITASNSSYIVKLSKGEEVIFSPDKSVKTQVASLQLIQKRLTIEGKRFLKLDLRFTNPIIVFE